MSRSTEEDLELLKLLEEDEIYRKYHFRETYLPDKGLYSRDKYPKLVEFFASGKDYPERLLIAANRTGKSLAGCFEMSCHLSGLYPQWWEGRVQVRPGKYWFAGLDFLKTRDVLQNYLVGERSEVGTGLVPKDLIKRLVTKPGVPDGIETCEIWWKKNQCTQNCRLGMCDCPGEFSTGQFKSYVPGYKDFVGSAIDGIQLDEEPPAQVYLECLVRTMTKKGFIITTFTPDEGITETILSFFKDGVLKVGQVSESKFVTNITWDDVPHLTKEEKEKLMAAMMPHQIEAKTKGLPYLGAGAIYPIPESQILVDPFPIPAYWKKFYGLDVGWNATAAVWVALDPQSNVYYVYSEYMRGQAEPSVHADGIKSRGAWINGAIDPASQGRSQVDGRTLLDQYNKHGLILWTADNSVESGIMQVYQMLSSGRLKFMSNLQGLLGEYRLYRRDEKGKIIKQNDHRMDALRYAIVSGSLFAMSETDIEEETERLSKPRLTHNSSFITGY